MIRPLTQSLFYKSAIRADMRQAMREKTYFRTWGHRSEDWKSAREKIEKHFDFDATLHSMSLHTSALVRHHE